MQDKIRAVGQRCREKDYGERYQTGIKPTHLVPE